MTTLLDSGAALNSLLLSAPRIAAAFLVLPILSREDAPPMVRNTIYVALAVAVTPFVSSAAQVPADFVPWAGLIVKEIFVGAVIGFSFAAVLWAVSMAGDIIDTKVGTSMATLSDPMAGQQTSLSGALLSRFSGFVFLAVGGLTIFLDLLLGSYLVWPVQAPFPAMDLRGIDYFARSFSSMMTLAFMLAAPALVLMSLIDLALGVMNRYAPQLNVLPIAMALKAWITSLILLLGLIAFFGVMVRSFDGSRGLLAILQRLFSP
jgi:type III secretion protein T